MRPIPHAPPLPHVLPNPSQTMRRHWCPGLQAGISREQEKKEMVIPARFERTTYRLGICRSILLSYGTSRSFPYPKTRSH